MDTPKIVRNFIKTSFIVFLGLHSGSFYGQPFSKELFENPTIEYWPRPFWFWNNTKVTEEGIVNQMQEFRDKCGYGGFSIIPFRKKFEPKYLSENYFRVYGVALSKAKELGLTMRLYDEYGFPSGSVGAFVTGDGIARFPLKYPEQIMKRLDKLEEDINGPLYYTKKVPEGKLMGVVAMNSTTLKRIDLTHKVHDGTFTWKVPSGKWKIMFFYCVKDGVALVDYLNPDCVRNFIGMTYEEYYKHFKDYFGTVIDGTFFDEPSMFFAQFRVWTGDFNDKFRKKYGFSPSILYPALWYDIGVETESARNYLFGLRAELFSEGLIKPINDWATAHGVSATGHTAPEEALIPTNSSGDLMKSFQYLKIPGIDKIGGNRPAERFYKLMSSVAYNWDKKMVMCETYGAMPNFKAPGDLTWNQIYSIAMDQYAKGINMLIPHAVWYDTNDVSYKPELSHRNPLYADSLKAFTQFLARLNVILQRDARHIADIAILYPIHTLLGEYYLDAPEGPATIDGPADPANEFYKKATAQIDYIDVANWLTDIVGKDYTFIHPEILDERCAVVDGTLHLQNKINWEKFNVLILPSCKTISISNMKKIKDFYEQGGKVIFTTRLPSKSVEPNNDKKINKIIHLIFPNRKAGEDMFSHNKKGGKAYFIPNPNGKNLREIILNTGVNFDVDYPLAENLRYIHKLIDNRHVYYFANIGGTPVETQITLNGNLNLECWDPHNGRRYEIVSENLKENAINNTLTRINLKLKPYHSYFLIEK